MLITNTTLAGPQGISANKGSEAPSSEPVANIDSKLTQTSANKSLEESVAAQTSHAASTKVVSESHVASGLEPDPGNLIDTFA
ncbi:MAG: hypothetical protein ACI845_004024 [Gammaproteobacteria bacterium]|jgi:hypothetical protein